MLSFFVTPHIHLNFAFSFASRLAALSLLYLFHKGPFKCYVTLFSRKLDRHPPPRNADNVEPYTFVTLFPWICDAPPPPSALRNTWMAPKSQNRYLILHEICVLWKLLHDAIIIIIYMYFLSKHTVCFRPRSQVPPSTTCKKCNVLKTNLRVIRIVAEESKNLNYTHFM